MRGIVVILSLCEIAMSSCAGISRQSAGATYSVATHPATEMNALARVDGVLFGQTNDDHTACLSFGEGPQSLALIWPDGYTARGTPLAVFDGAGKQVASVGQRIGIGGAPAADGTAVLGCREFQRALIVGRVDSS
jgi:hypothetical protein